MLHENLYPDVEIAFSAAGDGDLAHIPNSAVEGSSKSAYLTHFDKARWEVFRARTQDSYISLPFAG
eukprot:6197896-Pleurochrysis_carterae.AAC.1